ncbi:Photosystem II reaction center W protein, chloroplastic [Zea mays]|uniref:PSII 6.1 kDa protein n=2 Tax=Zea mays TaxID=4577 RepID=A0A1D6FSY7_MAIZE|nr:Photosystem II reaction center W protein, chloroplastic [Zea mays]AQK94674.1 Photosystem II reaction center W protein chloroplastic [Zea mays]PWZ10544.1 Photosystem II reaction center W protein, chloroplastic [Zea mays]
MATLSAAPLVGAAAVARPCQAQGLPQLRVRAEKARCGAAHSRRPSQRRDGNNGASSSLLAVATSAVTTSPALALVDERMSTEGTGLSLGLSNNLLGWILLGVFGLIWSLYTVYTSTLDEDDDSGLSL